MNECKACNQQHPGKACPVVDAEIVERRQQGWGFIPEEWRRHRYAGLKPEEIDYDLCHVFR